MHEICLKKCFKSKKKTFVNAIPIFALFATILQREGYIACSLFWFFAVVCWCILLSGCCLGFIECKSVNETPSIFNGGGAVGAR